MYQPFYTGHIWARRYSLVGLFVTIGTKPTSVRVMLWLRQPHNMTIFCSASRQEPKDQSVNAQFLLFSQFVVRFYNPFITEARHNSFMTAMAKILGRSHLNIANRRIFPIQYSFRVIHDPERGLHIIPRSVMAHCSKTLRRPLLIGNLTACNTLYRLHAKHKSTSSCQVHCFSFSWKFGLSGLLSSRTSGRTVL